MIPKYKVGDTVFYKGKGGKILDVKQNPASLAGGGYEIEYKYSVLVERVLFCDEKYLSLAPPENKNLNRTIIATAVASYIAADNAQKDCDKILDEIKDLKKQNNLNSSPVDNSNTKNKSGCASVVILLFSIFCFLFFVLVFFL